MKRSLKITAGSIVILSIALSASACSSGKSGSDGEVLHLKWSTWGNPGELKRFYELTDQYNKDHPKTQWELVAVPNDGYEEKIITQLQGGTAPDAFYAGDQTVVKLIANGSIAELTQLMDKPSSPIKASDFAEGLWGGSKKGDQIFGVTVDCNPLVIYYNKKVLQDAGITEDPQALYEAGQWNWQKLSELTGKIQAAGKYGLVLEDWSAPIYSWVTTNGGKVYDKDQGGQFVGDKDPKTVEAFQYLADNVKNKNFVFSGSLPKGQGPDAMFMANQVGFGIAGRWWVPEYNANTALQYDIVPLPTNTGQKMEPAGIPTAYMVMNKKTAHPDETYDFLSYFVSKEGQTFRLKGGNAVPSVSGVDDLVLDKNAQPAHAQYFLDAREIGYALWPSESAVPGASDVVKDNYDLLLLGKQDAATTLTKMAEGVNKKIAEATGK
ncbi:carbohydrate ABC transporter substrate-binding protein (CUT1 family) [Paenibacillus taihuensis]|uniref:Carbohydrate ABC transporter substrate-binding protein (CUT1 family) n=1 Tax=Paenibacillus taihuensis TaxID=1156355 RepID=A0A3D9RNM1_9BACL|nr:sugar ABC transporter substrate-binding protein [Paenibacillus taihuensis]REE81499.1 carbohydrate ABC transporter substrate-binding protein (CUT1 family) [Paenibacillus taihuensis]